MHWMTQLLAGATSIWLGVLICGEAADAFANTVEVEQPTTPPSINSIREMSELTVLAVETTEFVSHEISGQTGSTSIVLLAHGTVTYGVELEESACLQTDHERHHLVLSLPQPTVRQVAIDPHASQVLSCKRTGLWQLAIGPACEDKALMSALTIGHDQLVDVGTRDDLISQARRHAEAVLARFVSELGWSLDIRWDE